MIHYDCDYIDSLQFPKGLESLSQCLQNYLKLDWQPWYPPLRGCGWSKQDRSATLWGHLSGDSGHDSRPGLQHFPSGLCLFHTQPLQPHLCKQTNPLVRDKLHRHRHEKWKQTWVYPWGHSLSDFDYSNKKYSQSSSGMCCTENTPTEAIWLPVLCPITQEGWLNTLPFFSSQRPRELYVIQLSYIYLYLATTLPCWLRAARSVPHP